MGLGITLQQETVETPLPYNACTLQYTVTYQRSMLMQHLLPFWSTHFTK